MSNILVTGRNGFVGRALVEQLKKKHNVISLIRNKKEGLDYSNEELILSDQQTVRAMDVQKYKVELIIHLAATLRGKADYLLRNNVKFSEIVFNIAEAMNIPVIYLSSTNVLFTDNLGAYSYSKKRCENLLMKSKINYLILRVPLIIGRDSSSIETVKNFYQKFSFFPLFGQQKGKVQPIHISSLVNKILSKIEEGNYNCEILNIVGDHVYNYREVIVYLLGQNKKPRFIMIPFLLSKFIINTFEKLNINSFISMEELKSVNIDKIINVGGSNKIEYVNNDKQILFD